MHPRMWLHPATQRNVAELSAQGRVQLLGPVEGEVASGDVGPGRMVEPAQIAEAVMASLAPADLEGLRFVVTAGPTIEDLDPVRFISNRSTGKMGFAVAERAAARGARVTLIAGPVALPTPARVERIDVRSAQAMGDALAKALGEGGLLADVVVMAAAVADYRPATPSPGKIKKDGQRIAMEFVQNPDLLAEIGAARRGKRPVIVGFVVETEPEEALVRAAQAKRDAKGADLMVANRAADAFAAEDNRATLVSKDAVETLPRMSKRALSDVILDRARVMWRSGQR
jgi:phosphopantothenoylcysteine decarboxylase/phosphopantothenate--cysteine ligase